MGLSEKLGKIEIFQELDLEKNRSVVLVRDFDRRIGFRGIPAE
jgi:hypothetical protein